MHYLQQRKTKFVANITRPHDLDTIRAETGDMA